MEIKEFIESINRTWNYQTPEIDKLHALLGIQTEIGELLTAVKKEVGYGKELDRVNILEEEGDFWYFCLKLYDIYLQGDISKFYLDSSSLFNRNLIERPTVLQYNGIIGNCFERNKVVADLFNLIKIDDINRSNHYISTELTQYLRILLRLSYLNLRNYGFTLDECFERNHEKRKARFPEKFDQHLALNRNLEVERQVLEGNIEINGDTIGVINPKSE